MKRIERTIINALRKGPMKTTAIALRFGLTEPAARRHLERLQARNLVICDKGQRPYVWTVNLHDPFFRGKGERVKLEFESGMEFHSGPNHTFLMAWIECKCGVFIYISQMMTTCSTCKRKLKMVVNVEAWDEPEQQKE